VKIFIQLACTSVLGKFMDPLITPQTNLALQVIILALLFTSLGLKRGREYFLHGATMLVAVLLNAASFLLIMWPSLLRLREFITTNTLDRFSLITMTHAILGSVAEIIAVWIVATWHLQGSTQSCVRKKRLMRVTFVLWATALILGILFYMLSYTSIFS